MSTGHVLQYVLPSVLEYFVINIFLLEFVKPALIPYLNIFNNQQFEKKKDSSMNESKWRDLRNTSCEVRMCPPVRAWGPEVYQESDSEVM